MQILSVTAPGEFEIQEVPVPQPGPEEVLMRVEAVTTCPRWDINIHNNTPMFEGHVFEYPITSGHPGHEAAGTVAALGEGVTDFNVGQRICAWRDLGHGRQGAYAQFVVMPVDAILAIPQEIPACRITSLELGMCVGATFLRLKKFDAIKGHRVGIMGLGPAGLIAAQIARAEGAGEVIGFDMSKSRRDFAAELLDGVYDPRETGREFPARPEATGIDTIIDCVGAKASVEWAMDHAEYFAALFGVQKEPYSFASRHYNNLTLVGYPGHSIEAAQYALELVTIGKLDLEMLATHHLPLSKYTEGVSLLESQQAIKVCFNPWD